MRLIKKFQYGGPPNVSVDPSTISKNVKKDFYDYLDPWSAYYIKPALKNVINKVPYDYSFKPYEYKGSDTDPDTIYAMYLGIPESERHFKLKDLEESDYKPTKGSQTSKYYRLNFTDDDWKGLFNISNDNDLSFGLNINTDQEDSKNLGIYTVGRGLDPLRGEYISYYDKWDINPFRGKYEAGNSNFITNMLGLNEKDDILSGILDTHPVEVYDRKYLDDYYGTSSAPEEGDYYGGYLPELYVYYNNNTEKSGSIGVPPMHF